jgi:hypothetical protein
MSHRTGAKSSLDILFRSAQPPLRYVSSQIIDEHELKTACLSHYDKLNNSVEFTVGLHSHKLTFD